MHAEVGPAPGGADGVRQVLGEGGDVGEAIGRNPLQAAQYRGLHPRRHCRSHGPDRARWLGHPAGHDGLRGRTREGWLARQHLVEHARQAVLVGARVHRAGAGLLRAHVRGRAERHAGTGEALAAGLDQRLGDPEIRHVHPVARQQQVLGLDVAVDDAVAVCCPEGRRSLAGDPYRLVNRQLPFSLEPDAQRLSRHVRHRVPGQRSGVGRGDDAGIEHWNDVGMLEPGGETDLAEEAVHADRTGELGVEHLDRHRAVESVVARQPHRCHAASAQLALNRVPVAECCVQAIEHVTP